VRLRFLDRRKMKKSVYIIGSKGIPAKYGGFETFVEKLTEYQQDRANKDAGLSYRYEGFGSDFFYC